MDFQEAARRLHSRYLILGFSLGTWFELPRGVSRDLLEGIPPYIVCTTGLKNARIVSLKLREKAKVSPRDIGQWRLCIEVEQNPLSTARRILSGFEGLFTQLFHGRIDDLSLQLLPGGVIRNRAIHGSVLMQRIEAQAHKKGEIFQKETFESRLWSFMSVPDTLVAFLLFQLPVLLQTDWLFTASTFFQSACSDFAFIGDAISDILRRRNMPVEQERDRLKLENVVLSSFRTVEAIVGEPGKEEKFRKRLTSRGLNFDELVGFPGTRRKKLGLNIYSLQKLRDVTSAHGVRRRSKPVTWFEAMEAQHLAESIFHQALWSECCKRGRPEGSDEETSYLLQKMYPFISPTDWPATTFKELGDMTPIEAIRQPGGPEKVGNMANQLSRA